MNLSNPLHRVLRGLLAVCIPFSFLGASAVVANPGNPTLLAVGPARIQSLNEGAFVGVLGQLIAIDEDTMFDDGFVGDGDYVAVYGSIEANTPPSASAIVSLGGFYSIGNSLVYFKSTITRQVDGTRLQVGGTIVDISQVLYDPNLLNLSVGDPVEIVGFEIENESNAPMLFAVEASRTDELASNGVRGITGSGVRGITGSGVRGITGSGVRGITGSGVRGITGSGVRGLSQPGKR